MKEFVSVGAVLAAVAMSAVSCSSGSPQDKANDACSTVKKVVDAQPRLGPNDNGTAFIPVIDKELGAARKAQTKLAGARAAADFTAAWKNMLGAMQGNRQAWQNVTPWRGVPGSETIGILNLAGASKKVDQAKKSLTTAARKHGYTTCADIKWQY